jgi:hypothetical protein
MLVFFAPMENINKLAVTRDSDKFMLRLPGGMRERISSAAKDSGRSMNAEIVARLQGSFEPSLASLNWLDLVKILEEEARKRGTTISITVG